MCTETVAWLLRTIAPVRAAPVAQSLHRVLLGLVEDGWLYYSLVVNKVIYISKLYFKPYNH